MIIIIIVRIRPQIEPEIIDGKTVLVVKIVEAPEAQITIYLNIKVHMILIMKININITKKMMNQRKKIF